MAPAPTAAGSEQEAHPGLSEQFSEVYDLFNLMRPLAPHLKHLCLNVSRLEYLHCNWPMVRPAGLTLACSPAPAVCLLHRTCSSRSGALPTPPRALRASIYKPTRMHSCTHAHTHARTHTSTHAHTRTHRRPSARQALPAAAASSRCTWCLAASVGGSTRAALRAAGAAARNDGAQEPCHLSACRHQSADGDAH